MPLYDYYCNECNEEFEAMSAIKDRLIHPCSKCGSSCKVKMSAPRVRLDPISGDFPGATMKWDRNRKQKMAQEVKQDKTNLV